VIVPDANLLLYAYDSASPFHGRAAGWWSSCLNGAEPIGLCPAVVFGFVRIGTSSRAFVKPLSVEEASTHVESWFARPMVQLLETDLTDVQKALELLREAGTGGNLTTDAQVAAISVRYGAVAHTADSDFARFRGVRWHNPLMDRASD
jgi:toxin-antitoxin system PIN domain toxin